MSEEMGLTVKKSEDFSKWYLEVLQKSEVLDERYGVKGFVIYMPTGTFLLRRMQDIFEEGLQKTGHKAVIFPVIIPEKNLSKETEHIKGFEGEVFWITHGGYNKLEERLCLRPTSETAFYPMYSIWLRSHTQLPFKLYQAVSAYRAETKMTKPLIRGREFFWIEAHTAQKTFEDADKQVEEDMGIFEKGLSSLCLPFLLCQRPEWDKFAGAEKTHAYDAVLPDGKVLQIGTTHNLGEKFSKPFDIKYMDQNGKKTYVNQTTFGIGLSRIIGALVAIHGDDKGLILPPAVAPTQIVIVPIYTAETKTKVMEKAGELLGKLEEKNFRVILDDREGKTPGFKFHEWELKGVPLRIEIGPRDLEKGQVVLTRRDFLERIPIAEEKLEEQALEVLDSIGFQLQKRAKELLKVTEAKTIKDMKKALEEKGGFVHIDFCGHESCAKKIKDDTGAEVRGTIVGKKEPAKGNCVVCGKKAVQKVYAARSY